MFKTSLNRPHLALLLAAALALPVVHAKPLKTGKAAKPAPAAEAAPAVPKVSGQTVAFQSGDGTLLSGVWYGPEHADRVVLLSHQYNRTQDDWAPLLPGLLAQGYAVLTYNFRGYPPSAGKIDLSHIADDLRAASTFARSRGAGHLALVSASMGGIVTVPAALDIQPDLYVLLSSPGAYGSIAAPDEALKASTAAKLFINSKYDSYLADTTHMHEVAGGTKALQVFPGGAHGADLLSGDGAPVVIRAISDFIAANWRS
ncbi:Alpha/beta hydrolase family protein [Andreprevotia lacus DSM 23236]|jgi:alpha-beta hydrolase superfamily lysophospholipase|uniref:Alpha/beta hydrolase family protein n=1 Tax=Andreprevotia lacus DSM 23236 TaxID=1121001 RepID=A0A1W1X5Q2_9NEIS|nr:alpha/beta hydrolase [Andreprevotia lacus]SMC19170.1 Alpha/beta hydrolase family protein [Andreprevotia lacus DSM 23236]